MNDTNPKSQKPKKSILERKKFMCFFMFCLVVYILLSGYILFFSGSLFFEGIVKGWYRPETNDFDKNSLWLGYLYGFPSVCGVFGGLLVLSTSWKRFYNIKVLFFIPAVVWSTLLVIGNLKWGLEYWTQWLFLVPIMALCIFILYCVVNKVNIPILAFKPGRSPSEKSSQTEIS